MLKFITIFLIVFIMGTQAAYAGKSVSFGIGCTIPAIPGVNVPLAQTEIIPEEIAKDFPQGKNQEKTTQIEERKEGSRIILVKTIVVK